MKDHEIAQLVNELTEIAVKYRDTQQLRQQISNIVNDKLKSNITHLGTLRAGDIMTVDYNYRQGLVGIQIKVDLNENPQDDSHAIHDPDIKRDKQYIVGRTTVL